MKIVKLHGGVMTMEPGSPRGLLVTVRLPWRGPGPSSEGPEFEGFTA